MTVEEMKEEIKNKCINTDCEECYLCPLYNNKGNCYECLKSEEIKRNYELMFGKEESKMKNEFDFNELKAGYAIKVPAYVDELIIGIPYGENEIVFYSRQFNKVVRKEEITTGFVLKEYIPIEVYGLSSSDELFDPSTRPLLYKKEDMNQKIYKINDMTIEPNYKGGYKSEEKYEGCIYINRKNEDEFCGISINKSELNDVINALTEIRNFIKEDK